MRRVTPVWIAALAALAACSQSLQLGTNDAGLVLSTNWAIVAQDGSPTTVVVTLSGDAKAQTVSVTGLPMGVTYTCTSGGKSCADASGSSTATLTFTTTADVAAGDYWGATVQASATAGGGQSAQPQAFQLTIATAAKVSNSIDSSKGIGGRLDEFVSTSFQPAPWQSQFFVMHPDTGDLEALQSQHIHVQIYDPPYSPPPSDSWDFTELDDIVQPLLRVGDRSPLLQINNSPFDVSGNLASSNPSVWSANVAAFADYCAKLVRYYNMGGFSYNGVPLVTPGSQPIVWWGILGDSNVTLSSGSLYAQIYAAAAAAMLAVDPSIRISAVEFADYASGGGAKPGQYFQDFLGQLALLDPSLRDRLANRTDVLSLHFYSTSNLNDKDTAVFATIPSFVQDVKSLRTLLPTIPNATVWVTQNNVNADVPNQSSDGVWYSQNNPTQPFQNDTRGTSAFFAAWRPYLFSQLAKAGNGALYHWDYTSGHATGPSLDDQNAEVKYDSGDKYIGYWVDYWLARMFSSTPASSPRFLTLSVLQQVDPVSAELLATKNDDGSVVLMLANFAVRSPEPAAKFRADGCPTDDDLTAGGTQIPQVNNPGKPQSVVADVSELSFASASSWTIDGLLGSSVGLINGPKEQVVGDTAKGGYASLSQDRTRLTMSLCGYGVQFVKLAP